MESRIKKFKKKLKLNKNQLNYQTNLALITKLPSSTLKALRSFTGKGFQLTTDTNSKLN